MGDEWLHLADLWLGSVGHTERRDDPHHRARFGWARLQGMRATPNVNGMCRRVVHGTSYTRLPGREVTAEKVSSSIRSDSSACNQNVL